MASQVIIELGTDWGPPEADPGAAVPRGGYLRWWGALGATLAVLLGTSAAAVAPGPRLVEVANFPNAGTNAVLSVDGQTTLIIDESRVAAYDAATGARRWEVTLPGMPTDQPIWFADRIMLPFQEQFSAAGLQPADRLAVIDRATGGWKVVEQAGYPTRFGPNTILIHGDVEASPGVFVRTPLTVFDVDRMAVVHTIPASVSWTTSPDSSAVYTLSADATLSEWDAESWALRRSVALPVRLLDWTNIWASERLLSVRTGLSVVNDGPQFEQAGSTVRLSLDLATLEPVEESSPWHRDDCGPVWCAYPLDDLQNVLVLDKSTGERLWRMESHRVMVPSLAGVLLVDLMTAETGPLVVGIVDPFTGRVLTGLKGWTLVTSAYLMPTRDEPPYLLRADPAQGSAFLAVATADGIDLIGELDFNVRHCDFAGRFLACADGGGGVRLLRVDR